MRTNLVFALALFVGLVFSAAALAAEEASDGPVYVDPRKAQQESEAYRLQGEYGGVVQGGKDSRERVGAQVIALGEGRFRVVCYGGGLPGEGWTGKSEERAAEEGRAENGGVVFQHKGLSASLKDGRMVVRGKDGKELGTLKKVHRESPTLGKQPPENATVLFDGSRNALQKHWQSGASMTDAGLLKEGATTSGEYGDFTLHVEFRLPFVPAAAAQHRGNSGCYILNRYEVQMLDSFGLEPKNNHCGAIYEFKAPLINMAYPPLAWQTYDIDFTAPRFSDSGEKTENARITVRHNGTIVQDDVEVPHGTGSRKGKAEQPLGPIILQEHNNPVRYRNVWIVDKSGK